MNVKKLAEKDAFNWARAEMFFGEGAGTRRKLLGSEIAFKGDTIDGYIEAFQKAYSKQNMADHAIKAAKERKRLDRGKYFKKNTRALARGDRRNVSPLILVGIAGALVLHETGYDTVLIEKGKRQYQKLRAKYAEYKLGQEPGKHE